MVVFMYDYLTQLNNPNEARVVIGFVFKEKDPEKKAKILEEMGKIDYQHAELPVTECLQAEW